MDNISLRPVYGKKTTTSITTTTPTPSTTSTNTQQQSPSVSHQQQQKSPSTVLHNATVPAKKKESADDQEIDKTDTGKAYYTKSFLKKIQPQCTDVPPELQPIFEDYPELKPVQRRSGEHKGQSPQHQRHQGQKKPYNPNAKKNPQQPQSPQQRQQQPPQQQGQKKTWNQQFFFNEKEQFLRTVQGTLNKLAPDTFDKLSHQIVDMIVQCNNPEMYSEAVSMVFIKAVGEINFTRLYTQLCVKLNQTQPKNLTDPDSFRKILLAKCQQEFEAVASGEAAETNLPEDPDERAALKDKQRKRKIGNVKFIGELFKAKLLSERIVHDCIRHLVSDILRYKTDATKEDREFNAELLSKLLTTVGKFLDHEKGKQYMDAYFAQVGKFSVDSQQFSSRIRFLLQDLLDLRSNRWVPRRQENTPKTISEVHAEAAMKEFEDDFGVAPVSPRPAAVAPTPAQPPPSTEASKEATKPKPKPQKKKQPPKPKQPETLTIDEPVFISSEGEYEEKIKPILQDYLGSHDLKATVSAIKDLEAPEYRHKLVETSIVLSLEKGDKEREATSKLLSALSSDRLLKEDNYVKGLKAVAAMVPDLKPDIPHITKYLQTFVANAIAANAISTNAANKIQLA